MENIESIPTETLWQKFMACMAVDAYKAAQRYNMELIRRGEKVK